MSAHAPRGTPGHRCLRGRSGARDAPGKLHPQAWHEATLSTAPAVERGAQPPVRPIALGRPRNPRDAPLRPLAVLGGAESPPPKTRARGTPSGPSVPDIGHGGKCLVLVGLGGVG